MPALGQVADGCTDELLATPTVTMVRKHAVNPENLIAGAFQRSVVQTCSLLTEGAEVLRTYSETCGAEPDLNQRVARAALRLRALLCAESSLASDAAAEWTCWQPRATSFWNCAQQADWAGSAQACQLLDKLSACYEREAAEWCGAGSGRAIRRLVLRTLAPLPAPQCAELERAGHRPPRAQSWNAVILVGVGILVNLVLAILVMGCCTWWRRRRTRQQQAAREEAEDALL